jgi:hypothetical protein
MARRKKHAVTRTRTVVVYRQGVIGYYSRDRIEGGISPIYSTAAYLAEARAARAEATTAGTSRRWAAAH